jgi:hypothetical protein
MGESKNNFMFLKKIKKGKKEEKNDFFLKDEIKRKKVN